MSAEAAKLHQNRLKLLSPADNKPASPKPDQAVSSPILLGKTIDMVLDHEDETPFTLPNDMEVYEAPDGDFEQATRTAEAFDEPGIEKVGAFLWRSFAQKSLPLQGIDLERPLKEFMARKLGDFWIGEHAIIFRVYNDQKKVPSQNDQKSLPNSSKSFIPFFKNRFIEKNNIGIPIDEIKYRAIIRKGHLGVLSPEKPQEEIAELQPAETATVVAPETPQIPASSGSNNAALDQFIVTPNDSDIKKAA